MRLKLVEQVPIDIRKIPADSNNNGFIVGDLWTESTVGDDGEIYVRQNNKVYVEID